MTDRSLIDSIDLNLFSLEQRASELSRPVTEDIFYFLERKEYPSLEQISQIVEIARKIVDRMEARYSDVEDKGVLLVSSDREECSLMWRCVGLGQGTYTGCSCGVSFDKEDKVSFILMKGEGKRKLFSSISDEIPFSNLDHYLDIVCDFMMRNRDAGVDSDKPEEKASIDDILSSRFYRKSRLIYNDLNGLINDFDKIFQKENKTPAMIAYWRSGHKFLLYAKEMLEEAESALFHAKDEFQSKEN